MSLIQQALERTSRAQETRTRTPAPAAKPWDRDPMGAKLEQDLIRIQEEYVRRRKLYWKISLGVLAVCFIAGLSYVGWRQIFSGEKSSPVTVVVPVAPQVPVKIYSGNIYRLTGITDLSGKAIAVINGRLVGVGDALDGKAVVKTIGVGEVRLDVQGKEIRLAL
jgi:hypothetical protein